MTRLALAACAAIWLAACAGHTPSAGPSDDEIREQASRCGIRPEQQIWRVDKAGRREMLIGTGPDVDTFSARSFICMMDWAKRHHARVGFISEPPPADSQEPEDDSAP